MEKDFKKKGYSFKYLISNNSYLFSLNRFVYARGICDVDDVVSSIIGKILH